MKNIPRAWAVCLGCALTLAVGFGAGSFVLFAEAKTLWGDYLAGMRAGVSYGLGAMLPASILMLRRFLSRCGNGHRHLRGGNWRLRRRGFPNFKRAH